MSEQETARAHLSSGDSASKAVCGEQEYNVLNGTHLIYQNIVCCNSPQGMVVELERDRGSTQTRGSVGGEGERERTAILRLLLLVSWNCVALSHIALRDPVYIGEHSTIIIIPLPPEFSLWETVVYYRRIYRYRAAHSNVYNV